MAVRVREANPADAEALVAFLSRSFRRPTEDIRPKITDDWSMRGPKLGYLLEADGQVVGLIGAIYSRRNIESRSIQVCNMRNWAIDVEFRQHSLKLLRALLDSGSDIITNFSASAKIEPILLRFGFKQIDTGSFVIPAYDARLPKASDSICVDSETVIAEARPSEAQILRDHVRYGCVIASAKSHGLRHTFVFLPRRVWRLAAADLLFVSQPSLVQDNLSLVRRVARMATGAPLLLVEGRRLAQRPLFSRFVPRSSYCRSTNNAVAEVDRLYSEVVLRFGVPRSATVP